jgi:hypothetical protein
LAIVPGKNRFATVQKAPPNIAPVKREGTIVPPDHPEPRLREKARILKKSRISRSLKVTGCSGHPLLHYSSFPEPGGKKEPIAPTASPPRTGLKTGWRGISKKISFV